MIVLQELEIFGVLHSQLNMEGKRKKIKNLQPCFQIVVRHCIEKSLLIANNIVIDQMVVHPLLRDIFYCLLEVKMFAS